MRILQFWISLGFISITIVTCKNKIKPLAKIQPKGFASFVKNFDTLTPPLIISYPNFLKENVYQFQTLKKIDVKDMQDYMKMDSLIPYPVYYYGQLPMKDSTYYLINYFEIKDNVNPSMWWTLMKFNYYGELLSETNISYCLKDSNMIEERFCKINPTLNCFYVEVKGKWDEKNKAIIDTSISQHTINLTLDQHR